MFLQCIALGALATAAVTAASTTFHLHHRIVFPGSLDSPPEWVPRGSVTLNSTTSPFNASLTPSNASPLLAVPATILNDESLASSARYEVSVTPDGEEPPTAIGYTLTRSISKPLCSLNPPTYGPAILIDHLVLHVTEQEGAEGGELQGIAWDQVSPCVVKRGIKVQGMVKALERVGVWKTTVDVRTPIRISLPPLPPSPKTYIINPDGTSTLPVPVVERSFLAKYGWYIAPVIILLLMGGGEEPKGESRNVGGTGVKPQGQR